MMADTRRTPAISIIAIEKANKACSPSTPKRQQKVLPLMVDYIPFGEPCRNGQHANVNTFSKTTANDLVKMFLRDCKSSGIDTDCKIVKDFVRNIRQGRKIGSRNEHRLVNDYAESRGMADCNNLPDVSKNPNKDNTVVKSAPVVSSGTDNDLKTEPTIEEIQSELQKNLGTWDDDIEDDIQDVIAGTTNTANVNHDVVFNIRDMMPLLSDLLKVPLDENDPDTKNYRNCLGRFM